jgi:hypothetical protein
MRESSDSRDSSLIERRDSRRARHNYVCAAQEKFDCDILIRVLISAHASNARRALRNARALRAAASHRHRRNNPVHDVETLSA